MCAREHGTDTQHPELLPAFPSGFVIASAARSACIMSWDKVMSLAGFMFNHYHLGICVPDPQHFQLHKRSPGKQLAQPREFLSHMKELQSLQVCASRAGKTAVFKQFYLNKHRFCSLQIDNLSTQELQRE